MSLQDLMLPLLGKEVRGHGPLLQEDEQALARPHRNASGRHGRHKLELGRVCRSWVMDPHDHGHDHHRGRLRLVDVKARSHPVDSALLWVSAWSSYRDNIRTYNGLHELHKSADQVERNRLVKAIHDHGLEVEKLAVLRRYHNANDHHAQHM